MSRCFDGLLALVMGKHLKMVANCGIIVINVMMVARKLQNISIFRLKQCENRLKCKQKFTKQHKKREVLNQRVQRKAQEYMIAVMSFGRSCSGVVFRCNLAKTTI